MPLTLGVHIGHDGGCALCRDGEVVVACAEERLTRVKYANGWWGSLRYCLEAADVTLDDVDLVVFSNAGDPLPQRFDGHLSRWTSSPPRAATVDHHLSHAIGAFAFCDSDEALVFVGDAGGNSGVTESVFLMNQRGFELLLRSSPGRPRAQGLGSTYEAFTNFLGFADQESGKTMALAGYGDPSAFPMQLFDVSTNGQIRSRLRLTHQWGVEEFARRAGVELGSAFPPSTSQKAKDIAAYVQSQFVQALEAAVLAVAARSGARTVCLSGGIALNCVAHSQLRTSLGPRSYYAFPASSDCGLAMGNAFYGHWLLEHVIPKPKNRSMRFGRLYSEAEIDSALQRHPDTVPVGRLRLGELRYTRTDDAARDAADLVANGAVVGWWQGRSETGPRALGGRSILADPKTREIRDRLNDRVKRREWFRPFGPAVLLEDATTYLEAARAYPYMIEAPKVQPAAARDFPACVHVDGSARIQTVDHSPDCDAFRSLLEELRQRKGNSAILNTSFNIREPIVESPADALATFLSSSIDALVLGDYLCFRSADPVAHLSQRACGLTPGDATSDEHGS